MISNKYIALAVVASVLFTAVLAEQAGNKTEEPARISGLYAEITGAAGKLYNTAKGVGGSIISHIPIVSNLAGYRTSSNKTAEASTATPANAEAAAEATNEQANTAASEEAQPEQAQSKEAQPEQAQAEETQPEQAQVEEAQPEQAEPEETQPEQAKAQESKVESQ